MLTPWKIIIVRYLREPKEEILLNELLAIWPELHPDDKDKIYHFLYLSKQWNTFLCLFLIDSKERAQEFPWLQFFAILSSSKIEIPDGYKESLRKSLKRQNIRIKELTSIKESLKLLLTKKRYAFLQFVQAKKQELLASAKIAHSEQLFDKQVDYLNELKKLFPTDISVKKIVSEREKFNADQVLSKIGRIKKKKSKQKSFLSEDEKEFVQQVADQAKSYLKKNPHLANDFSIMFRNFGAFEQSIEFIQKGDNEAAMDWQLLDLYLIGRQYLALLSHCELLKVKYAGEPNALFSVSYAEALAYWELGEKNKAIQLMTQIASMKPDFKSANEILLEWREESID